jgi:plasmid rolling circle replication initiator protein Rep
VRQREVPLCRIGLQKLLIIVVPNKANEIANHMHLFILTTVTLFGNI